MPYTYGGNSSSGGGGYSYTAPPAAAGGAGLDQLLAQLQAQGASQNHSMMGLLGNLVGGATDIVGGLGKWALGDLYGLAKEGVAAITPLPVL